MAAGGSGESPASAVLLAKDVNKGHLEPLEQHWFKFTPDKAEVAEVENSLTLIFTPNEANTINYISLKIFEEGQTQFFYEGDASKMANLGAGQIVTRDNNPETGEFFWNGWVSTQKTYYIQVLNSSDFPIDYWLFNADVTNPSLGEPKVPAAAAEPAVAPQLGTDPSNPAPLTSGTIKGTLAPSSTYWYTFSYPAFDQDRIKDLDFSLFFTPDDGHRRHNVNFELYPASELGIWQRGDGDKLTNFGAGMLVSRDGDYNTGERIWRGSVLKGDTYLMAIRNDADVQIDYWLFDDDIYTPILGPEPAPAAARVFARGVAPQTAVPLKLGVNKGGLEPGEEAWYSFFITDFDNENLEEMALTMVTTPDDGNRIHYMTFDVFTAGETRLWSPGDNSQIKNMGAGSIVYRDDNPLTGERFWSGWVIDNNRYYVQIRNGANTHMDYWLFTGDVYRPELGPKTEPVARVAAAPGTAPTSPKDLKVGVNRGRLNPRQEQWYAFSRGDVGKTGSVETVFTVVFTPDDGNRIHDVNFELFESNQLRDWAPDNRFNLTNFGQGSIVNRDGDPKTGELLWKGHIWAGDVYYMRVSNETDEVIDYWIFPEDVINTNLEEQ